MSDLVELLLVLGALYLAECAVWTQRSGLALLRSWGRTRVLFPPELLGNPEAGLMFSNPLPPLGDLFIVPAWPCSLSSEGLSIGPPLRVDPAARPLHEPVLLPMATVGSARSEDSRVLFDDGTAWDLGSSDEAQRWTQRLVALSTARPREREVRIRAWLRESLRDDELQSRLASFDAALGSLDPTVLVLFTLLFLLGPLAVWQYGLEHTWIPLLSLTGVAWLAVLAAVRAATQRLLSTGVRCSLSSWVTMAILPLAAIRARDTLARRLLAGFDPVFCAAALASQRAGPVVRSAQRQLAHPRGGEELASVRWFRLLYRDELTLALEPLGYDEAAALKAPDREPECLAYCPRCHDQFTSVTATCSACDARELTPF